MKKLDTVKKIIVHHSASAFGTERDIHMWHVGRGFSDTGYHYVILSDKLDPVLDGMICPGRPTEFMGAHCKRHNSDSLGVCLIGHGAFTIKQLNSLWFLLKRLCLTNNLDIKLDVCGHDEFVPTECPGFDIKGWIKDKERNNPKTLLEKRVEKIEKTLKRLGH